MQHPFCAWSGTSPHDRGQVAWWSSATGGRGRLLLVLGLVVFLVANGVTPASAQECPAPVGVQDFGVLYQAPNDVGVVGSYMYTADYHGLTVYDVTTPSAIVQVGQLLLPDEGLGIEVSGGYAYVALGESGLQVVDVSDPSLPTVAGVVDTPGVAQAVAVSAGYAYVADGEAGLQVIDVSDPSSGLLVGTLPVDTPGEVRGVAVSAGFVYLAEDRTRLQVVDVSNPSSPVVVGVCDTLLFAPEDVTVSGSEAYVVGPPGGLSVIDVSDPSTPQELGSTGLSSSSDVEVSDGLAYVVGPDDLSVVDVSGSWPTLVGSLVVPGEGRHLALVGSTVYVAESQGLDVVDVSDPAPPVMVASLPTWGDARAIAVEGAHLYVAGSPGLTVLDIADPWWPTVVDALELPEPARDVAVAGGYAYVADGDAGLQVVDVSDPESMSVVGTVSVSRAEGVAMHGTYAYLAVRGFGIFVVDVSEPWSPTIVSGWDDTGGIEDLALLDGIACAYGNQRGWILDLGDPLWPVTMSQLETPGVFGGAAMVGSYAYLAAGRSGMGVFDLSDASSPVLVGVVSTVGSVWDVAVSGDVAFAACDTGLALVDVTTPGQPFVAAHVPTGRGSSSVALSLGTATSWLALGPEVVGVDVGCATCAGLSVVADPAIVQTGGQTSEVTVTVRDFTGDPIAGQSITAASSLGVVGPMADNGNGTYTATYTSGAESGRDEIAVGVNGSECRATGDVRVLCASGTPTVPGQVRVERGFEKVRVTWSASSGAVGYRIYRDGTLIAEVGGSATTEFGDDSVAPGTTYCYTVTSVDGCGGETPPSGEECVTTLGAPVCPIDIGRSAMDYGNGRFFGDLAIVGSLAYVADGYGLSIYSLLDPGAPQHVGTWDGPEGGRGVTVEGGSAYVTAGDSGLYIVDVSDPSAPSAIGSVDTPGTAQRVVVSGKYAHVADGEEGLQVVDVSDPAAPTVVASLNPGWDVVDVALAIDHVYVADADDRFHVVDVSDPATPAVVGGIDPVIFGDEPTAVEVDGNRAFLLEWTRLQVVDVSDPAAPEIMGTASVRRWATALSVGNGHAFVRSPLNYYGWSGLQVLDVSDPMSPSVEGELEMPWDHWGGGVAASGAHVCVAHSLDGMRVVEVSDPASPEIVGDTGTVGSATNVVVVGSYAYVANGERGLWILDVSDPSTVTLVGTVGTPDAAVDVAISGEHAYLACHASGLQVVDISDPATPFIVGGVETGSNVEQVGVSGGFAYVEGGGCDSVFSECGLFVIDVSDPVAPMVVSTVQRLQENGDAEDVAVSGDYVFVAGMYPGLRVVDVSQPTSPLVVADVGHYSSGVVVVSGYAYVVNGSELQVLDVSAPTWPVVAATLETPGDASDVAVVGDYVFVADGEGGLLVVDIWDPTDPVLEGQIPTRRPADQGVVVAGGRAYVPTVAYLEVFSLSCSTVGDVNLDGGIDGLDIEALLDFLYRGVIPDGNPDCDGSGAVDGADIGCLIERISSLD